MSESAFKNLCNSSVITFHENFVSSLILLKITILTQDYRAKEVMRKQTEISKPGGFCTATFF